MMGVWLSKCAGQVMVVLERWWMVVVERPCRRDYVTVVFLLVVQVLVLGFAAVMSGFLVEQLEMSSGEADGRATENPGVLGFFAHNFLVFLAWVVGGLLSFGLVAVVFAGVSALYDGFVIGAAIQGYGVGQLFFLGHGLLEVPAFAIGLYLGVRPVLVLLRIKVGNNIYFMREVFSGFILWLGCALVLLFGAAVWEAAVEVPAAR